jgi:hypothetical protein
MLKKRLPQILAILAVLSFSLIPPADSGYASPNQTWSPLIQTMLDQVDQNQVHTITGNLSGEWPVMIDTQPYTITTRHALSGEPIQKASQYLFQYYQDLGLETSYQNFTYRGRQLSNVVAQKTGTVFPERVFMITSHFDDVPLTPLAPGADDNASGTVAVMLAASILNQYEFGCTLRFVNFNAEEYGMIGSGDYARGAYCAGEDIQGVLNLDMIAWNTPETAPEMDLHALSTIPESSHMASVFQEVVTTYDLQITPTLADPIITRSDHARFWNLDIPAILVTEDGDDFNPNYHSANDRLNTFQDFDYYTEMIKASLGTLAQIGCLVETGWGDISGIVTDQNTHLPLPNASVTLHNPEWGYTFYTQTDQKGEYQISALQGSHSLSADGINYAAAANSGLMITHDQSTTMDIELAPLDERLIYFPLSTKAPNQPPAGCP